MLPSTSGEGAYWFDDEQTYLTLPAQQGTGFSGDFTIAFYVKSCVPGKKTALVLGKESDRSLLIAFDTTAGSEVILNGQSYLSGSMRAFTDGLTHHVLLRRAGRNVEFFIDGNKRWTKNISGTIGTKADFRISGEDNPWKGAIDEISIYYDYAFDDGEVLQAAFEGFPRTKGPWQSVTCNANFKRRDGLGALTFKGKMWLLGGWNPSDSDGHNEFQVNPIPENQTSFPGPDGDSQEVWSSTNGKDWVFVTNAPWEQRHMAGWAVFQDKMWVIGGDSNNQHFQNDVWWSNDGKTWVKIEPPTEFGWKNRILHHVEVFKNKLWLMGGQRSAGPGDYYNDVWSSEDGIMWKLETQHAAWSPRGAVTGSAVFKDKMWLIGGGLYGEKFYNDIYNSSDGKRWTKVNAKIPFSPRYYHDVHVLDGKLWVTGGFDPYGNLNDVYFSEDGLRWTQVVNTDWGARHALGVWVYKNSLYVGAGNLWNDVWKLTPSSASFKQLNTYYRDRDLDGFGDPDSPVLAKSPSLPGSLERWGTDKTDCNDKDININPTTVGCP